MGTALMAVGAYRPLDDALRIAFTELIAWIRAETMLSDLDAYQLLSPLLGTSLASALFAIALLCSGQNATLTGTLAGQIVMEGFINLRLRPWLRQAKAGFVSDHSHSQAPQPPRAVENSYRASIH